MDSNHAKLKSLPTLPGVYQFKNKRDKIIYIGKASKLKSRVRSYFGSARSLEPRVQILSKQIADIEHIVTENATEALHLEATLVNRHQPHHNVRLKDDKHYPYLNNRTEATRQLLTSLKQQFDPKNLINPGSLGFDKH